MPHRPPREWFRRCSGRGERPRRKRGGSVGRVTWAIWQRKSQGEKRATTRAHGEGTMAPYEKEEEAPAQTSRSTRRSAHKREEPRMGAATAPPVRGTAGTPPGIGSRPVAPRRPQRAFSARASTRPLARRKRGKRGQSDENPYKVDPREGTVVVVGLSAMEPLAARDAYELGAVADSVTARRSPCVSSWRCAAGRRRRSRRSLRSEPVGDQAARGAPRPSSHPLCKVRRRLTTNRSRGEGQGACETGRPSCLVPPRSTADGSTEPTPQSGSQDTLGHAGP